MHVVQVCRHTCGTGGGHECLHASKHAYGVGKDEDGVSQDWLIAEGVGSDDDDIRKERQRVKKDQARSHAALGEIEAEKAELAARMATLEARSREIKETGKVNPEGQRDLYDKLARRRCADCPKDEVDPTLEGRALWQSMEKAHQPSRAVRADAPPPKGSSKGKGSKGKGKASSSSASSSASGRTSSERVSTPTPSVHKR